MTTPTKPKHIHEKKDKEVIVINDLTHFLVEVNVFHDDGFEFRILLDRHRSDKSGGAYRTYQGKKTKWTWTKTSTSVEVHQTGTKVRLDGFNFIRPAGEGKYFPPQKGWRCGWKMAQVGKK